MGLGSVSAIILHVVCICFGVFLRCFADWVVVGDDDAGASRRVSSPLDY